jgi:hypothetical protein
MNRLILLAFVPGCLSPVAACGAGSEVTAGTLYASTVDDCIARERAIVRETETREAAEEALEVERARCDAELARIVEEARHGE